MSDVRRELLLRVQLLVLGGALWALVHVLPWLHLRADGALPAGATLRDAPLLLLPPLALLVGLVRGHAPWLLAAVPLSLLPGLLVEPALTSARVYGFPAFVATSAAVAAWIVLAGRAGAPRPARAREGAPRAAPALARARLVGGGLLVVLVGAFLAFAWWAAFDPAVVWSGATAGEAAATRPLGRTVPALVLAAVWLVIVTTVIGPLAVSLVAARVRPRLADDGGEDGEGEDGGGADGDRVGDARVSTAPEEA